MPKYQHSTKGTIISVPEETLLSAEWQPYPSEQEPSPKTPTRGKGKTTKAVTPETGAQE